MTRVFMASATALAFLAGSQVPGDPGSSLTAIASEIRLLRASIEKGNESQVQIQAISVYLTNEQGRLTQLATRLDAVRHDLDAAAADSREAASNLATMEAAIAANRYPDAEKTQIERVLADNRRLADLKAQNEAQLRVRETEAQRAFEADRDQYTALIARLQQFIK